MEKCVLGIGISRKIVKENKNEKKNEKKKHVTFLLYKMSKRSIPVKLKQNPTTCEEKLFFQETKSNCSKSQVTKLGTLIFGITTHKTLNHTALN